MLATVGAVGGAVDNAKHLTKQKNLFLLPTFLNANLEQEFVVATVAVVVWY